MDTQKFDKRTETAACGGSNIKAPLRLDFMRRLRRTTQSDWPQIYIARQEGRVSVPMCFGSESEAADPMNCIGLIASPSDELVALLRAGPVLARVSSLCTADGSPCALESMDAWGFLAEYSVNNKLRSALEEAAFRASEEGRGHIELLLAKVEYMTQQAVPETIALKTLKSIVPDSRYPWLIPDPPVKYAQSDAAG